MNRKITFLAALFHFLGVFVWAQRPAIDTNSLGKWPIIKSAKISNDGKFVLYLENYEDQGSNILHIRSVQSSREYKLEVRGGRINSTFSNNSNQVLCLTNDNVLRIVDLGNYQVKTILQVTSFKLPVSGAWVAWKSRENILTISNSETGQKYLFKDVREYYFDVTGSKLATAINIHDESRQQEVSVNLVDLQTGSVESIWQGKGFGSLAFDHTGKQLAIVGIQDVSSTLENYALYCFKDGMAKAKEVVNNSRLGLENGMKITTGGQLYFSNDDDKILLRVEKSVLTKPDIGYKNLTILNALDNHREDAPQANYYWVVVLLTSGKLVALNENDHETLFIDGMPRDSLGNICFEHYLLVQTDANMKRWKQNDQRKFKLVNLDGSKSERIVLKAFEPLIEFSPGERYLIWFDQADLNYYSYKLPSGTKHNISEHIRRPVFQHVPQFSLQYGYPGWGIAGYTKDGQSIYLYDQYDIWRVDLTGAARPVNITRGFGRKHGIAFGFLPPDGYGVYKLIDETKPIVLIGYDATTKKNGFWQLNMNGSSPVKLRMENAYYYAQQNRLGRSFRRSWQPDAMKPAKAKNADVYLLNCQTEKDYPNLYVTENFRELKPMSDFHPEANYNWLTAVLLTWKTVAGEVEQGILYKPENFDPSKKYPVLFNYYENRSDELHKYYLPDWIHSNIDIPYFVSNGYLVFVPDMGFHFLHNGRGATLDVASGAKYLARFSYVNKAKIGVEGQSYGGYETNYIVTHSSNVFAAACSVSSTADLASSFLRDPDGLPGQLDLGTERTPWSSTSLYLENSPIYGVGKATTPLILVRGTLDRDYYQAVMMYHALRRANKKCWLLTYNKAGHGLYGDDAKDFTVRLKQYFDYFLKDAPSPVWLTDTFHGDQPISTSLELK